MSLPLSAQAAVPDLVVAASGPGVGWRSAAGAYVYGSAYSASEGGAGSIALGTGFNLAGVYRPTTGSALGLADPGRVRWIATHGWAGLTTDELAALGAPVSSSTASNSFIAATDAALWHFATGGDVDRATPGVGSASDDLDFLALYDWFVANATSLPEAPVSGPQIGEATASGTAAPGLIGPLTVSSPRGAMLTLTGAPSSTRIVDALGAPMPALVSGSQQVYLSVPACSGAAAGSFAVTATGAQEVGEGALWGLPSRWVITPGSMALVDAAADSATVGWSDTTTCPGGSGPAGADGAPGSDGAPGAPGASGATRPGLAAVTFRNRRSAHAVRPGRAIVFSVTVRNRGTATASRLRVSEALPPGFAFTSPSGVLLKARHGVTVRTIGDLAPGHATTVTFRAVARAPAARGIEYAIATVTAANGIVTGTRAALVKILPRR